jgi:hypothetical protein
MRRFSYFFTLLVRLNIFALDRNEKFRLSSRWTNVEYLIYVLIIMHMATTELINDNTILNKRALLRPPALSVGRGQQTNQKKRSVPRIWRGDTVVSVAVSSAVSSSRRHPCHMHQHPPYEQLLAAVVAGASCTYWPKSLLSLLSLPALFSVRVR